MERYYDNGLALWGLKCGERRITEPIFLEVFDIKGEMAAVRYQDGNTGIVNNEGECVKRFPKLLSIIMRRSGQRYDHLLVSVGLVLSYPNFSIVCYKISWKLG